MGVISVMPFRSREMCSPSSSIRGDSAGADALGKACDESETELQRADGFDSHGLEAVNDGVRDDLDTIEAESRTESDSAMDEAVVGATGLWLEPLLLALSGTASFSSAASPNLSGSSTICRFSPPCLISPIDCARRLCLNGVGSEPFFSCLRLLGRAAGSECSRWGARKVPLPLPLDCPAIVEPVVVVETERSDMALDDGRKVLRFGMLGLGDMRFCGRTRRTGEARS